VPQPITLTRVNIAPSKYFATFKGDSGIVQEEITKSQLDSTPTKDGYIWLSSSEKIAFDTPTGMLADWQYATQSNGFHWIKIPGYTMIKIDPVYISKNILSQAGANFIHLKAGTE
jgi:hypothetical protein